jgi:hypothetical protein
MIIGDIELTAYQGFGRQRQGGQGRDYANVAE